MKANKSPGPDGLPAEFYQRFWSFVGPNILFFFNEFFMVD
jgi:hypothetical protein